MPTATAPVLARNRLIRTGKGELLMKGSLHTDELMQAVTSGATGLRTERRISHVFVMDVPTYAEQGFPLFQAASWVGVFAPAKTDPVIVKKLNAAVEEVIKDQAMQDKLKAIGFDPIHGSPDEADKYFRAEVKKWGEMVDALGLSIN